MNRKTKFHYFYLLLFAVLASIGCAHSKTTKFSFYKKSTGYSFERITELSQEINADDFNYKGRPNSLVSAPISGRPRVGIIEFGIATGMNSGLISTRSFGVSQNEIFARHAETVIQSFRSRDSSGSEIYQCGIEDLSFLKDCLKWLHENQVAGISISIDIPYLAGNTGKFLQEMIDSGVVVTYAAGNLGIIASGFCREFKKVICVGMLDKSGLPSPTSNFGPYISAWENGILFNRISGNEGSGTVEIHEGTSISAPRHLAAIMSRKRGR